MSRINCTKKAVSFLLSLVLMAWLFTPMLANAAPSGPELLNNGSFANGLTGWSAKENSFELATTDSSDGDGKCVNAVSFGDEYATWEQLEQNVSGLLPNTDYILTYKHKGKSCTVSIVDWNNGGNSWGNETAKIEHFDDVDSNWTEYTLPFKTGSNSPNVSLILKNTIGPNDTAFFDEFSLKLNTTTTPADITINTYQTSVSTETTTITGFLNVDCNLTYKVGNQDPVPLALNKVTGEEKYTFSVDIPLEFGENKIVFTADNGVKSTKTITVTSTYDKPVVKPVLTLSSKTKTVYQSTYYLAGSVDVNSQIVYKINGGTNHEAELNNELQFNQKLTLSAGATSIEVYAIPIKNGVPQQDKKSDSKTITVTYNNNAATSDNPNAWDWTDVELNGMGWVTGVVSSPTTPYQIYARTDVGGVNRFNRDTNRWEQILDSFGVDNRTAFNVDGLAVDPEDGNTVYFAANGIKGYGEVYVSKNAGNTWTATGLANFGKIVCNGNGDNRDTTGERLMVDPNNSNIVYFASRENGLFKYNGTNWSKISSGVPTNTNASSTDNAGFTFTAFDENGGTTTVNGKTVSKNMYVGVLDTDAAKAGVYKSQDGGQTFTKMSGFSESCRRGTVNKDGTLFVTTVTGVGRAERGANSLTKVLTANGISPIMVLPNGKDVVVMKNNKDGKVYTFANGESAYTEANMVNGKNTPYQDTDWCHSERGGTAIDYADSTGKTAFAGTGFGVVRTTNLLDTSSVRWDDFTQGISELVVTNIVASPVQGGKDVHLGVWDMGGFSIDDRDTVPTSRLNEKNTTGNPEWNVPLTGITGMAYSFLYPKYMAYTGWHEFGYYTNYAWKFGTTVDGGYHWDEKSTVLNTKESAGAIAISSTNPNNMVWSPVGGIMKYSNDFGKTWNDASAQIGQGVTTTFTFDNSIKTIYERKMPHWGATQNLAADKVKGDVFYLFTEKNTNEAEFWRSTDAGKTWLRTYQGHIGDSTENSEGVTDEIDAKAIPFANVRTNPAKEGDVFVAIKPAFDGTDTDKVFDYKPLWRSTNKNCTDFDKVANVQLAIDVAFGKGDSKEVPYIYIIGKANGDTTSGVYVSKDNAQTWIRISDNNTQFGNANSLEADMREKNLVYVGTSGRGVIYGKGEPDTTEDFDYGWKDVYKTDMGTDSKDEPADYSAVDAAIEKADALKKSEYKDFSEVTDAINAVVRNKTVKEQEIVDGYATAIEAAINRLEKKSENSTKDQLADYSAVDVAIAKADSLTESDYKDFSEVADAIKAVVRNKTAKEQDIVDGYAAAIEAAIDRLEKKSENVSNESGVTDIPLTGDSGNIFLGVSMICISCGALIAVAMVYYKKTHNKKSNNEELQK